jgi:hypothetical protein
MLCKRCLAASDLDRSCQRRLTVIDRHLDIGIDQPDVALDAFLDLLLNLVAGSHSRSLNSQIVDNLPDSSDIRHHLLGQHLRDVRVHVPSQCHDSFVDPDDDLPRVRHRIVAQRPGDLPSDLANVQIRGR